jgi:unsaturated rhamnogalacturonyl hydrolase
MSNSTARLAGILPQVKARDTALPGFLLALFVASCQSGTSAPNTAAAGAGQTSSAQTGGASGTGGPATAAATGGTSGPAGSSSTTISGGTTASGGVAAGGTSSVAAGDSGGAGGAGGVTTSGGATRVGGTTGQAGSTSNGTASVAGGAGRGGASGGVPGTAGTTSAAGTTSKGGSGGSTSAVDAGAAGQSGGDAGTTTLAADSLAVRFANMILSKWPDPKDINTTAGFEYNHGIVLRGMEQVYRHTQDSRYLAYIQKYIDENVTTSGTINLGTTFVAFDDMQPSVLLPFLYQETGTAKYKTAADSVQAFYAKIPTNGDGGYWHKEVYPNQMWLDGIYMGEPFLARYAAVFGTCSTCGDTVVKQATLIAAHTQDTATGLYYHAWWDNNPTGTTKPPWADANGRSPSIWGRAMGWYAMALVDTLGDLPASQTGRSDLMTILTGVAAGLKATQDAKTGLWYQVMDQGSKSDNWTETSASGMFVYALKVAVNRGYIDSSYSAVADSGWTGLQAKVTTDASSGVPSITGAVQGMNVQNDYAGYVGQKTLTNSSHGLCAILLAAAEMEAR